MSIVRCAFLATLVLAATACSKKDEGAKSESTAPKQAETAPAPAPAPTPAPAPAPAPTPAPPPAEAMHLYMDVHDLGAGKVKAADVAEAHKKDLAVEGKYHVDFKAYWVDEKAGKVYCLSEAPNPDAITATHKEAHGLLPSKILPVVAANDVAPVKLDKGMHLYMDVHELGAGKVTPDAVAEAHKKDLAVEGKHKTQFLDYFVDPDSGTVMCLAEAPTAADAIKTHKEAHGLIPKSMDEVVQGGTDK